MANHFVGFVCFRAAAWRPASTFPYAPRRRKTVRGAGIDSLSKTRAKGHLADRVSPAALTGRTRIEVRLQYSLVGPLAQFSSSGLVKDFAQRLMIEFAKNLKERITKPELPHRQAELRAGNLFLSVMWQRIKRLFGATS